MNEAVVDDDDTIPDDENPLRPELRNADAVAVAVSDWAAATTQGLVRSANEDRWGSDGSGLFAVADGMGGHDGGQLASSTAIEALLEIAAGEENPDWARVADEINERVRSAGSAAGFPEAGSTLVVLRHGGSHATLVNIGDSRAYRLRAGTLELLTTDHTLRQDLLDAGYDVDSLAESRRSLAGLTGYLGGTSVRVDVRSITVQPGDRILLCSDGVHGQVGADRIVELLAERNAEDCATRLIEASDAAGGRDNATAVVVAFG